MKYCAAFVLYLPLVDMYVKLSTSDSDYFLPFFDVFCVEVHPVRRQKSRHVYNVGITNDVNVNPVSKNDDVRLLSLNLDLSRDVCEPVVGSVVKILDGPIKKGLFCPLSRKTCRMQCFFFILMNCRCQIMCVHVALQKSIHFREIFE